MGIGTTTPSHALQIVTNSPGNGIYLNAQTFGAGYFLARAGNLEGFFSVAGHTGGYSGAALANDAVLGAQGAPSNGNLIFTTQNAAGNIKFATGSSPSNDTTKMIITNAGNVGIRTSTPGKSLDVVGDIRASGCFLAGATTIGGTCSSDLRFKTNIQPFSQVLPKLAQLRPVHFNWRTEEFPDRHFGTERSTGLIAQEVEGVFPDMVSTDASGYKMVNYSQLPYLLLEGVRELKAENDNLKSTVSRQQEEIETQQVLLKKQQELIAQLASQVTVLQASLKVKRQSAPAVRYAKASASPTSRAQAPSFKQAAGAGR